MTAAQGLHDEGLISYHRTDSTTLSQKALGEAASGDQGHLRRRVPHRAAPVPDQGPQRAGSARGDPADRLRSPAAATLSGLDADEARIYELIWKRAIASQMADARLLRTTVEITARRRRRRRRVFTATGKAIQFAGFLRAYVEGSDDPAAALDDQETILPTLSRGQVGRRRRRGRAAADARAARLEGTRDHAAGALHRRVAGEAPRGRGHRPAVDLRVDHQDDPAARLRVPAGQGAGPELHGVRGHRAAAHALLRLRRSRLHRGDGGGPRPDRQRRARRRSTSSASSIAAATGRPGLEQRVRRRRSDQLSRGRRRHRPGDRTCRSASASAATARSCSAAKAATGNTASLPDDVAPADFTVEQAVELLKAKAEGPRVARRPIRRRGRRSTC